MKLRIVNFKDWQTEKGVIYAHSEKTYPVTIDQDIRLKTLMKSCRFKETLRGMNGSFLSEQAIPLQAEYSLLRFDHEISGRRAQRFFANIQRVPATLRELLCFFLSLPSLRPLQHDAIALSSRWYDGEYKRICIPFVNTRWKLRLTIGEGCYTNQDVFLMRGKEEIRHSPTSATDLLYQNESESE